MSKHTEILSERTNKKVLFDKNNYFVDFEDVDEDDAIKKLEKTRNTLMERANNFYHIHKKENLSSEKSNELYPFKGFDGYKIPKISKPVIIILLAKMLPFGIIKKGFLNNKKP